VILNTYFEKYYFRYNFLSKPIYLIHKNEMQVIILKDEVVEESIILVVEQKMKVDLECKLGRWVDNNKVVVLSIIIIDLIRCFRYWF
jgi:hypothetical protein